MPRLQQVAGLIALALGFAFGYWFVSNFLLNR